MRKYGLIGYPLGHSFSKKYFTEKFVNEGIADCKYDNYELASLDYFQNLLAGNTALHGLNVTIPYKSDIIRYLDEISPDAKDIGAVNVLKIKRIQARSVISGFNSDTTGIRDSIMPFINPDVKNAIVLGTGGSSKAVCYVLRKIGISITSISRIRKPGILSYSDIDISLINSASLIINTTPLGMFPNVDGKPEINYNLLNKNHILFDLVYNPEVTAFLKEGINHGCRTISGLKMLHSQAERSWEIWNDDTL
jgi:shikimate dehydrogenase